MVPALGRLIRSLERTAGLDRGLEALPDDAALAAMVLEGRGLTKPELAVLVAYTKLDLKDALLESSVPDEAFTAPWLYGYFPEVLARGAPSTWTPIRCAARSSPPGWSTRWSTGAGSPTPCAPRRSPVLRRRRSPAPSP